MLTPFTNKADAKDSVQNYLIAIGIDRYTHLPRLSNAVKDLKDIVQVLLEQYQFSADRSRFLYDEEATQDNIYDCLKQIKLNIKKQDNLILFFSGHGDYNNIFDNGYWIPVDARRHRINDYIPNTTIVDYLRKMDAHHILVVVDSCFAGTLISHNRAVSNSEKYPSCRIFVSGRKKVEDGLPGKNSPFARSIIDFLTKNRKMAFKITDLIEVVKKEVERQTYQAPFDARIRDSSDQNGELVIYRKKVAAAESNKEEPQEKRIQQNFAKLVREADVLFERMQYEYAFLKYKESLKCFVDDLGSTLDKAYIQDRMNTALNYQKAIQFLLEGNMFFENAEYRKALELFEKSNALRKDKSTTHLIERCKRKLNPRSITIKKKIIEVNPPSSSQNVIVEDLYAPSSSHYGFSSQIESYSVDSAFRKRDSANRYIVVSLLFLTMMLSYVICTKQKAELQSNLFSRKLTPKEMSIDQSNEKVNTVSFEKEIRIVSGSEVNIRSYHNTTNSRIKEQAVRGDSLEVLNRKLIISSEDAMICTRPTIFYYQKNGEQLKQRMNRGKAVQYLQPYSENEKYCFVELEMDDLQKEKGLIKKADLIKVGKKVWLEVVHKRTRKQGWIVEDYVTK